MASEDAHQTITNAIATEVRALFDFFEKKPTYSYERVLGKGSYGTACLVKQHKNGALFRKFVVKRGIDIAGARALETEIKALDYLAGALHIVQRIVLSDIDDIEDYLPGQVLIVEYLPNGTLARFIDRLENTSARVSNRLLWRLFLCCESTRGPKTPRRQVLSTPHYSDQSLYRHVIPFERAGKRRRRARETAQESRSKYPDCAWRLTLEQWYISRLYVGHQRGLSLTGDVTVVFGEFKGAREHDLSPVLKLIDFGSATIYDLTDHDEYASIHPA
jgi:hypothetical protein